MQLSQKDIEVAVLDSNSEDREWEFAVRSFRKGDKAGALFIFKKIASSGCPAAYVEIGNIYEIGGGGVEQDFVVAKEWYERSVKEIGDPMAYLALGRLYLGGKGVQKNYQKAHYCFTQIENPDKPGALFALGVLYENGLGVIRNRKAALSYYKKAADLGHVMALKHFGLLRIREGYWFAGLKIWFKSCVLILKIAFNNPEDKRIRVA